MAPMSVGRGHHDLFVIFSKKIFSSLICGLRADGKAAQPGVEGDERSPGAEPVGFVRGDPPGA